MGNQESWWTIPVASLTIAVLAVLVLSCGHTQTDADEYLTPATLDGVREYNTRSCLSPGSMVALLPIKKHLRTDLSHSKTQSSQALVSKHLYTLHTCIPNTCIVLNTPKSQIVSNVSAMQQTNSVIWQKYYPIIYKHAKWQVITGVRSTALECELGCKLAACVLIKFSIFFVEIKKIVKIDWPQPHITCSLHTKFQIHIFCRSGEIACRKLHD